MKVFLFLCATLTLVVGQITSDCLSNNRDEVTSVPPTTERAPTSGRPKKCPGGMMLFELMSANNEDVSWKCECKPSFLYLSSTGSCHKAYRQGPCPPEQYLGPYVIPGTNETVGKCIDNPCLADGSVPYNGSCYTLGTSDGLCAHSYALGIDETTFRVTCRKIVTSNFPKLPVNVVDAPNRKQRIPCPPGMGRSSNGACISIWDDDEWSRALKNHGP